MEIAQVEAGDVYEDADGWNLFVRGKGGRTRTVPITADLARANHRQMRIDGAVRISWALRRTYGRQFCLTDRTPYFAWRMDAAQATPSVRNEGVLGRA